MTELYITTAWELADETVCVTTVPQLADEVVDVTTLQKLSDKTVYVTTFEQLADKVIYIANKPSGRLRGQVFCLRTAPLKLVSIHDRASAVGFVCADRQFCVVSSSNDVPSSRQKSTRSWPDKTVILKVQAH